MSTQKLHYKCLVISFLFPKALTHTPVIFNLMLAILLCSTGTLISNAVWVAVYDTGYKSLKYTRNKLLHLYSETLHL